jgi:hypothetical protein
MSKLEARLKRLEEQAAKDAQQSVHAGPWVIMNQGDYATNEEFEAAQQTALAAGNRLVLVMCPGSREAQDT